MKSFLFSTILISLLACVGCTTKFDINAPAKDIAVVYGLLNQADSTQYVKITKAFLGESSAYDMAQDPSLSSWGDDISVTVEERNSNGILSRTFVLQKTYVSNKDSGIFYSPNQEIYMFKPVPLLNSKNTYKINITNNNTGVKTNATTAMVYDFTVKDPTYNPLNPQIGFVSPNGVYNTTGEAKWISSKNSKIFEPLFRFHYREVDKATLDTTADKYIDWNLNSVKASTSEGGEELIASYNGESFFRTIQSKIAVNPAVDRIIGNVDFMISAGGDDLSIYIDLNSASGSIIQERPSYTNVTNGIGIFSCRYTKKYSYRLSSYSVTKLINGEYTSLLGFK